MNRTHGMRDSDEYRIWRHMRSRCENERMPAFDRYGGRGIVVCERWLDFANFLADMGPRPTKGHSLDRIDVDGNYEPGNCRWATEHEQQRNRRDTRLVTFAGVTASLAEHCERLGLKYKTVHRRLVCGADIDTALQAGRVRRFSIKPKVDALARTVERLLT